jgi:hypothetical protein
LKKHLLPRIRSLLGKDDTSGVTEDGFLPGLPSTSSHDNSPGSADWQAVIFHHDRMYKHKIMHINYTSYDVRQDQDIVYIGTRGQCNNVMVLAPEHIRLYGHPFWYARVLGIYHANVIYIGEGNADFLPRQLEFLWVRWYELEDQPETSQLARISFPPSSDDHSFGFLDPNDILRACHVIPLFRLGLACKNGPGLSSCGEDHDHTDWESYIANRWVSI